MVSNIKTHQGIVICPDRKIERFKDITGSDTKLMIAVCSLSGEENGLLELSRNVRADMMELFKVSKSTLSDMVKRLQDKNLAKRYDNMIMVNPDYMFKGVQKDYKSRKVVYEKIEQVVLIREQPKTYIMIDLSNGYYKIGKAINPSHREKTLQSEKPVVKMLHIIECDVEKELHIKYKDKRIRGEWFSLTTEDVGKIMQEYSR